MHKRTVKKQLRAQLEFKDRAIVRLQTIIDSADETYFRALGTTTFTAAPQATAAEF